MLTEHVAIGGKAYRVRGELLAQGDATPVVMVAIERDRDSYPSCGELRAAFSLTLAEARVAALLTERMSNREIARELDVTEHTARKHTERVLFKLGVRRRTEVRRELLRWMERRGSSRRVRRSGAGVATVVEASRTVAARELTSAARSRRGKKREPRGLGPKEHMIVLLEHESDRRAVQGASPDNAIVHFIGRPADLRAPWPWGTPTAVLVELSGETENELEHALEALRRTEPSVPVWGYVRLERGAVREMVRLTARGLITDVVIAEGDLRARLRELLERSREWSDVAALWSVWEELVSPGTRRIVAACIDASARPVTVYGVARQLGRSPRALRRDVQQLELPAVHRVLALCRLLRAMHRLDRYGSSIKAVASELGYPATYSLSHQLRHHARLSISGMPAGSRFAKLAALVRAEVMAIRDSARGSAPGNSHGGDGSGEGSAGYAGGDRKE